MGDMADDFRALREHLKEVKISRSDSALSVLAERGIAFQRLSDSHLRIGEYDFWPSTGLFIHRQTNRRARGVFNLVRRLEAK